MGFVLYSVLTCEIPVLNTSGKTLNLHSIIYKFKLIVSI